MFLSKKTGYDSSLYKKYISDNKCLDDLFSGDLYNGQLTRYDINDMYGFSSIGITPIKQEDGYVMLSHPGNDMFRMMIVCDGMGGHSNGASASQEALCRSVNWFLNLNPKYYYENSSVLKKLWQQELKRINRALRSYSDNRGTTYAGVILTNKEIISVNIGDSRIFYYNNDGRFFDYSVDQNASIGFYYNYFSIDDLRFLKGNNFLTNYLGYSKFECNLHNFPIDCWDKVIICSDGITKILSIKDFQYIFDFDCATIPELLVVRSNSAIISAPMKLKGDPLFYDILYGGNDNTTSVSCDVKRRARKK